MAQEPLFPDLNAAPDASAKASQNQTAALPPVLGAAEAPMTAPAPASVPMPDLFEDAPTGSTTMGGAGLVDSVVSTQDAKNQKILGPKPKISSALNAGAGQFNLGGLLFKLSLLFGVLVYGFFFVQLNGSLTFLSSNPSQKLASFETSFERDQTDINLYNLLMAKFALDDFMTSADGLLLKWTLYQSSYTANNVRDDLVGELGALQNKMGAALSRAKTHVSNPFYPQFLATSGKYAIPDLEQKYELLLKQKIQEQKTALKNNTETTADVELRNLDTVQALANDKAFRRELTALNLDETLTPETVASLFAKTTGINKNLFATILQVKNSRVNWPEVMAELERVTKKVDPLYGTTIQSNIDYSTLAVNASDRTISIRGETRTDDSLNFSLLSDLIDELEKSALFADVANRSFSKSGDVQATVTSSFNLAFALQTGEDPRDDTTGLADLSSVPFPSSLNGAAEESSAVSDEPETPEFPTFVEPDEAETPAPAETLEATEVPAEGPSAAEEAEAESVEPEATSPLSVNVMHVLDPAVNFVRDLFDPSDELRAALLEANPRVPRSPRSPRNR